MINHQKRNIIFLITIILLIFIGISCVSATDSNNTTQDDGVQHLVFTSTFVNINTGNDSWDGTNPIHTNGTVGPKQHISNGLNVSVNSGNLYIAAGTYKESKLTVTKNLTIIGEGKTNTTIDAMGSDLIFWIKPDTIVTIKNLNITNGTASVTDFSRNGGGIYNEGTLTIDNCSLSNNHAKDADDAGHAGGHDASPAGNGGAIYNKGTLTLTNSEISNNYAGNGGQATDTHKSSGGGNGGAIYNLGIILNIQACTFRNNYAGNGGKGSDFHDGGDGGDGGAIYNNGTLTISNSDINNSSAGKGGSGPGASKAGADGNGGGIYNSGLLTLQNSQIHNNSAGSGGGIYNIGAILTPVNTQIFNNTPDNYNNLNCVINNRTKEYYNSIQDAINDASSNDTLIIEPSTYKEDIITILKNINLIGTGQTNTIICGHIGIDTGYKVTITDLTINPETSSSITVIEGGGIYNSGNLTLKNVTISNCHADDKGGGIYNNGTLVIYDSTIIDNNVRVPDDPFSKDKGDGGGIYNSGVLTLYNTYIQSNLAKNSASQRVGDANGGGIYNTGTLNVYNCTFYDNTARNADDYADQIAGYGGAIFSTGFLNVVNCSFNSNKANEGYGGAIYYKNSTGLNIVNSTFTGNNAYGFDPNTEYYFRDDYGGAIYCNSNGGLSVTNSIFINNAAWGDGGAIYNTGGPLTLKNCTFTNNCANYGVITLGEVGAYGGHGGAIYNNNNNLVMTNCTLNNNVAMYGGALYCTGNGTYSVTNCSFNNNTVKAVDDNGNPLQVVTYSITGGWKAFVAATIKSISKTMLIYKISPKQGITSIVGDIIGIVKMINPNKDDVEAAGGAIYMLQSVSLSVNNCTFTDNTASLGGGICNFGNGTLTIKNSEFTGNAAGVGGAVYSNDLGPLNVTSNIFNGNCAHGGGAIGYTGSDSSQWGNLTVQENIFRNNDASLGGTVYDNFQGNTKIHMNFNLIYGTENYDIYDEVGKADVALNWWGINTGPSTYNVYGNITTSPWMVLTINSPDVYIGSNSTINFDMLHDSNGDYPNPAYGIVPNGIPVSLIVSNGTITSSMLTLINGIASTTYIANGNSGPVTINYTVDNNDHYLFSSTFNVLQIPTNIYLNSVGNFAGQNVTLVAKVTDNKDKLINGGNVTFHINIAPTITVPVINGYAEYYLKIPEFTQSLPYPISADYNGTNIYASSLATGSLYVNQAFPGSTGITVGPPVNGTQGQTVNLIAQLIDANNYQPLANKSLAFSVNGTNVGSAITDSNGVASLFYRILLVPGSYTILASFAADSPYTTSSNTGMLNVNPSPTGVSSLTITRNVQSIISLGDNFIVTIKIGNNGPDIAKDVVINFSIPEGLEFITASVDQGTWSYDESTRLFTWNLGDVAVGDPYLYLTLNAKKLGQYLLNHILTTLSYDPNLENQMTPLNIVITTPEENNGKESSVNAASKTIGMQETGLPVAGLILAILALLGGVASLKRK